MHPAASRLRAWFTFTLTGLLLVVLACPVWPTLDDPSARATLKGIPAIVVEVGDLTTDSKRSGLSTDQLRKDVESRLRKAGIKVVSDPSAEPESASLYLTVTPLRISPLGFYAFSVLLELVQGVALQRNPADYCPAITWSFGSTETVRTQNVRSRVRHTVADMVDRFINAYFEQNPKQ